MAEPPDLQDLAKRYLDLWQDQLRAMAQQLDLARYRKSTRGPKKPPRPKRKYKKGGHVSTYKELRDRKP